MDTTRPTLALIAGRTVGAIATFAIPMVLVRIFSPTDVGTYRELFLIFTTVYVLGQFGLSESLYYFVPRRDEGGGAHVANTMLALGIIGVLCAIAGVFAAPAAANWFDNPALGAHLPLLGIFLGLMLASAGLEIVMISRKRYLLAAATYAGSDVLRALALIVPPLLVGGVRAMLVGAIAFALCRVVVLAGVARREFGPELRLSAPRWKQQLAYTLPFGAAVTIEVLQVNYHQYAVASWFDAATFAIYSLGCLQIPVVELLGTSVINVMMVAMTERGGDRRAMLALWHGAVARLAMMFVPMVALLLLTAHDLITLLYTDAYVASVPVFMLSLALIVMYALPVDGALRVFAQTRFILGMNVFRLAFIAASIGWFVREFGLLGAMLVTVAATAIVKIAALYRIRSLLRAPIAELLPWRALGATLLATAIGVAPAVFVEAELALPRMIRVAVVGLTFGGTCLAVLALLRALQTATPPVPQEERVG